MKSIAIALLALMAASCAAPWFEEGGKSRGIGGLKNKWVDLVVKELEIHDVSSLGNGAYAIDFSFEVRSKRKTFDGKKYTGIVEDPFTVQAFVRMEGARAESETNADGEFVIVQDSVLMPLSFDVASAFAFPVTGPPPGADPNAVQGYPPGYTPPKFVPSPPGELLVVKPPMNPGEKRKFRRLAILTSLVPSGRPLELLVRADIYNDIHPEHDGNDKTNPKYKAPDFNATWPTNNEAAVTFALP